MSQNNKYLQFLDEVTNCKEKVNYLFKGKNRRKNRKEK